MGTNSAPRRNDLDRETAQFFRLHWNTFLLGAEPLWVELKPPFPAHIEYHEKCGCYAIQEGDDIVHIGAGDMNNVPVDSAMFNPEIARITVFLALDLSPEVCHLSMALAEYLNQKLSPIDYQGSLRKEFGGGWGSENTIFVALPPGKLRDKLGKLSSQLNCNLYVWDRNREDPEAGFPDLEFYVAIIDRRYFGEHAWSSLEEKYAGSEDHSALILIDDLDRSLLSIHHFRNYDENDLEAQAHVLQIVRLLYRLVTLGNPV